MQKYDIINKESIMQKEGMNIKQHDKYYELIKTYLDQLMLSFQIKTKRNGVSSEIINVTEKVFEILTSRQFCYLGKKRALSYKESVLEPLKRQIEQRIPLRFYLDIGGGYHASFLPNRDGLRFKVGLGELFALSQIQKFSERVLDVYKPGVRFHLVIDNMCAVLINDIPIEKTLLYIDSLRTLIKSVGMQELVGILVESDYFSESEYRDASAEDNLHALELTDKEHSNVARFLGRQCSKAEALQRTTRYRRVTEVSETLLNKLINGVHMTQRATKSTLCFRAYPGADSRIQCGEVALSTRSNGKMGPLLVTSTNFDSYDCSSYAFPGLLPDVISEVIYAERKGAC